MKAPPKTKPDLGETRINQKVIGLRLREMFDEIVSEPVPDDFLDILRNADPETPARDRDQGSGTER